MIVVPDHRSTLAGSQHAAARRWVRALAPVVSLVLMTGCYAYVPATRTSLAPASNVEVRLTTAGTTAMEATLGAGVQELRGTVLAVTADSLVLEVEKMYTGARQEFASSGGRVAIPGSYIDRTQLRQFSRKRTIVTIAVGGGMAVAAIAGAIAQGGGTVPGGIIIPSP